MEWNNEEDRPSEEYEFKPGGYFVDWNKKKENTFCNRECYEFNPKFPEDQDDKCCIHCIKFLTLQCPHIGDFIDDIETLDVD